MRILSKVLIAFSILASVFIVGNIAKAKVPECITVQTAIVTLEHTGKSGGVVPIELVSTIMEQYPQVSEQFGEVKYLVYARESDFSVRLWGFNEEGCYITRISRVGAMYLLEVLLGNAYVEPDGGI